MAFHAPHGASVVVFVLVVAGVVSAFVAGVHVANVRQQRPALRRTTAVAVGAALWLALLSGVVAAGLTERSPAPALMLFFLAANGMGVAVALSRVGRWLASGLPITALVAFQGFRLPLELVLHDWAGQGAIPATMTWTGSNFDVVTGVLALVAALPAGRWRSLAWAFDAIGLVLLLNVMRVAVLSSPLPFAWRLDPPLLLAMHLPYALIVPVCVAGALAGHVVLTRALLRRAPMTSTWAEGSSAPWPRVGGGRDREAGPRASR